MVFDKISIIGLGLIGGSLAKVISNNKLAIEVIGCDQSGILTKVLADKAISIGIPNLSYRICEADLIIIASPIATYENIFQFLAKNINYKKTLLTDISSVKNPIKQYFDTYCDYNLRLISSHPISGKEKSGYDYSTEELFKDKKVILSPISKTSLDDITLLHNFWEQLGSKPSILSCDIHDEIYAKISHLVQLISFCYLDLIKEYEKNNHIKFDHNYFKQEFFRLSHSSKTLWDDIFKANKVNISTAITIFKEEFCYNIELIKNKSFEQLNSKLNDIISANDKNSSSKFSYNSSTEQIFFDLLPKIIALTMFKFQNVIEFAGTGFLSLTKNIYGTSGDFVINIEKHINQLAIYADLFIKKLEDF